MDDQLPDHQAATDRRHLREPHHYARDVGVWLMLRPPRPKESTT